MASFLKNLFTRSADSSGASAKVGIYGDGLSIPSPSPELVTGADKALTLGTVYRCVTLISESVAALPLLHERQEGAAFTPVRDELTRLLSVEPNEWTSSNDFWRLAVQNILLHGEAYIVPQYDRFRALTRLVLASPNTAAPSCSQLGRYSINDPWQGLGGEYDESEVIRLKGATINGRDCLSVVGFAARTMSIAATADRNTLDTFASGGATMGIIANDLSTPGYGEIQGDALQSMADKVSRSIQRHERMVAVAGKVSYIPFTMTAADMQFLESRKFTVREICRFFGVHPSFVCDDTSNNYKSAEMANVAFLSNTLNPILRKIENELDRKLLGRNGGNRIRFDRAELHATDLDAKMRYVEKRIQTGTLTINEARALMGMQPVTGGDTLLASANLKSMTELAGGKGLKPETGNRKPGI